WTGPHHSVGSYRDHVHADLLVQSRRGAALAADALLVVVAASDSDPDDQCRGGGQRNELAPGPARNRGHRELLGDPGGEPLEGNVAQQARLLGLDLAQRRLAARAPFEMRLHPLALDAGKLAGGEP